MKAQLFITCLAEQFFPGVLEKMVGLLEKLGVEPVFPAEQTCCGQPLYNSGFQDQARQLAAKWVQTFSQSDLPVVSPSGSCVDMVRQHYPVLFSPGTSEHAQLIELAGRTYEFSEFLVNQLGQVDVGAEFPHRVAYHASCHLARELGVRQEPLQLLRAVRGLELVALEDAETCCGFGGVFSVVYPEVSRAMLRDKINHIRASNA
jgi:L-lactate dehydrogenase complex protein LldE